LLGAFFRRADCSCRPCAAMRVTVWLVVQVG
jgi:hypothetical protein